MGDYRVWLEYSGCQDGIGGIKNVFGEVGTDSLRHRGSGVTSLPTCRYFTEVVYGKDG